MTQCIFVGLSTIDVVYRVDQFPGANSKVVAASQDVFIGGPATNASLAFARLGGEAVLVSAVGRHPLAAAIRQELEKYSVQLADLHPQFDGEPVISSVSVDKDGNRNVISANTTRIAIPTVQVDRGVLDKARAVLVDGHAMPACKEWSKAAKSSGKPVVLDGGSWKDGTEELLKSIHTAICSSDFLPPGCKSKEDVIAYLQKAGVTNVAITDGANAIQFVAGPSSGTLAIPEVEVVDTTGAGDILHGAYCFFLASGRGFIESLAEGAKIASESCRYEGTREWMNHLAPIDLSE